MQFCIVFGIILVPFWRKVPWFWAIVFSMIFRMVFFTFFVRKCSPKGSNGDRNDANKVQESDPKPCRRTYSLLGSILARFWTDLGGFWSDFGSILQGFLKDLGVVFLSLLSCVSRAKLPKVTLTKHV